MDATIYYIVLVPALGDLLHTTDYARIGLYGSLILTCFMVGWAMGAVFFGVIADRFGRVKGLMWSIILYAVACGLCATSHNWIELAIYRFFVGLGIGGEINIGIIYLAESWQPKDRSWAISLSQTSFPVGMLIVSVFTYILGIAGWRWLFSVGIIPAFLTLYIRRSLSETKSTNNDSNTKLTYIPIKTQSEPTETVFSRDNILKLLLTTGLGTCAIVGYWAAVAWIPSWIDQISHVNAVDQKSAATFWMSMGGIAGCFFTPLAYYKNKNLLSVFWF
jgi:MFS family permease